MVSIAALTGMSYSTIICGLVDKWVSHDCNPVSSSCINCSVIATIFILLFFFVMVAFPILPNHCHLPTFAIVFPIAMFAAKNKVLIIAFDVRCGSNGEFEVSSRVR